MHRAEVLVLRTDSNHLVYYLDCIRVFGVQTCDESISIASSSADSLLIVVFM